ncbi:MAG: hypothetical protein Q4C15_04110 [Eubacteriales bacterium]|nr:hypothetical protein [Eubacteriales bacterium]
MFRKITSLLLVLSISFSLASCAAPSGFKQMIPELVKMEGYLEKERFDVSLFVQEEDILTRYDEWVASREAYEELQNIMRKVLSGKGTKVKDFNRDKITYPIIGMVVSPEEFNVINEPGESIVWTNGYLITDSGGVYKCDLDFDLITENNELFKSREYEFEFTYASGVFRNLAMAYDKWDESLMRTVQPEMMKAPNNVKAKVVREYENEKGKCVTVEFDNYSDKDWKFSSSGYLAIEINDAYYSIPNDPCFDGYTIGTLSYNCSVIRHEITSEDYFLVPYGDLPPADYILLIPAQAGSDTLFVQAEYTVK